MQPGQPVWTLSSYGLSQEIHCKEPRIVHNWLRLSCRQTIITQLGSRENYVWRLIAPGLPGCPSHWCRGFKHFSDSWHDLQLVSFFTDFLSNLMCPICCYLSNLPKELFWLMALFLCRNWAPNIFLRNLWLSKNWFLKLWFPDQQHQHHLGICQKCLNSQASF